MLKYERVDAQERDEIVDAVYRFATGMDLRDRALFESAFSQEGVLDLTRAAKRLGMELPVMRGRKAIADIIMDETNRIDTTHSVTNPRIVVYDGKRARLTALVEAQNLPRDDHSRHLLLKNLFTVELSRHDGAWTIDYLQIENLWLDGDPQVLFPQAA